MADDSKTTKTPEDDQSAAKATADAANAAAAAAEQAATAGGDITQTSVKSGAVQDPGDIPAVNPGVDLNAVMHMREEGQPDEPTYHDNRWKVGPGHSLLGGWVEGQEIPIERLAALLPKDDYDRALAFERLVSIGAIVPMADSEPIGGTAAGSLEFINVDPEIVAAGRAEAKPKVSGQVGALMQRIAGVPTQEEASKQRPAPKVPARG
jgi:hypothetical protein